MPADCSGSRLSGGQGTPQSARRDPGLHAAAVHAAMNESLYAARRATEHPHMAFSSDGMIGVTSLVGSEDINIERMRASEGSVDSRRCTPLT